MTFKAKTEKSTVISLLTLGVKRVKSVSHYKDLGIVRDIELWDDKDIQTQQRYQKFIFPDVRTQWKMYFFVPSVRPCMHHNYGVISWRHTSTDCLGFIKGCRALYNMPWRASVRSHQVQYNIPTFEVLLR